MPEDPPILRRIIDQLLAQGHDHNAAREIGTAAMIKAGNLHPDGTVTDQGRERGAMTPEERALDRAVKAGGGTADDYVYDESTNKTHRRHPLRKRGR